MRDPSEVIAEMALAASHGFSAPAYQVTKWADELRATLPASTPPGDDYLRCELQNLEREVTRLGVVLYHRDDGSFARAELPQPAAADVDDAMLERALNAYYTPAGWKDYEPEDDREDARKWMRYAIEATIKGDSHAG